MLFALLTLFAEDPPKPAPEQPGAALFQMMLLPMLLVMGYFLLFRSPMKRQEAERNALLASLKKNDRVLTNSGIYGTLIAISDKDDEVTVKVDDNVRLKMTKGSIVRKIEDTPKEGAAKEGA